MKRLSNFFLLLALPALLAFNACSEADNEKDVNEGKEMNNAIDRNNMDLSVKPGDDFFRYANGKWMAENSIPDEYSRYGSFDILNEQNEEKLKTLLQQASRSDAPEGSIEKQIGDFYFAGMDVQKIDRLGISPLKPELDKIDNISDKKQLQEQVAYMHKMLVRPVFSVQASQDQKNSEMMILSLYQGGLGLPDRDYYTDDNEHFKEIRKKYVEHISNIFRLMGDSEDEAGKAAQTVMNIEIRLAEHSMTRKDMRDPHLTYNKMTVDALQSAAPNFSWANYFEQIGLENPAEIIVRQPGFFEEFSRMMDDVKLDGWKTYLRWNLINSMGTYLSSDYVEESFNFYGKVLSGKKKNRDRWKRVLSVTNSSLSEAVGKVYVEKYFPPEAKERMLGLVEHLRLSFAERIKKLDWMTEETKEKALAKLGAISVKIGYPEKWTDYSSVEVTRDNYLRNVINARRFSFKDNIRKAGKKKDPAEWHMPPQMVNAYYNPTMNEIVFPAGILQPPFFFMNADDAVNYGGIGVVIGHEMTHGFDDQGRQYDLNGNLNDWWTKADEEKFNAKTKVIADQFSNFVVIDTMKLDGQLTLGENIADLGGLYIAYDALQKALEESGERQEIAGFTPEQRFFLSYAQLWRQNIRDEELIKRLKTDVHSPGEFRVNGPITNMNYFYKAFGIKEGDKHWLNEKDRALVW
ncbi:MAG: M13 family metallopeptidase [Candidatus Kapaibacterium sp.]